MFFSDIRQQGMSCLRTDGARNCTRYLFPKSSFPATARATMKHISLRSSIPVLLTVRYFTHTTRTTYATELALKSNGTYQLYLTEPLLVI